MPANTRRSPGRSASARLALSLAVAAAALLVPALAATTPAGAADTPAAEGAASPFESIRRFDVEATVRPDGSLLVAETIDYDFGTNHKHGIYRDIPVRVRYDDRYDRLYPIDMVSVDAGAGTPHDVKRESAPEGRTRLRIGDPDRTITGRHVYRIRYRVRGALNGFEDHDELVWNAVGTDWTVPVDAVSVTVHAPAAIRRVACSAGPFGSVLPCDAATVDGRTARFTDAGFGPGENLTFTIALPKGAVPDPRPILEERFSLDRAFSRTPASIGTAAALLAGILGGLAMLLRRVGRDRRYVGSPVDVAFGNADGREELVPVGERTVVPVEYVPPDGLRPGHLGVLQDLRADSIDVTATIVDLAVRGHLRIEEIEKKGWFGKADWNLVRLSPATPDPPLATWERTLLDHLFEDATGVPARAAAEAGLDCATPTLTAAADLGGRSIRLSALRNRFASSMAAVQDALYDDVAARGWFAGRPDRVHRRWSMIGCAALAAGIGAVYLAARYSHFALALVPLPLAGLLLVAVAGWMPRRTARGTAVLRRAQGFRRFIEESESERARFAERANLFSEYLPYAVVFGATEKWARAFSGLAGTPPGTSAWYVSNHAFAPDTFGQSVEHFAVTSVGTLTSKPASSGGSGFSGGGSSGGGGGGGGGGSW
ncbi:MAG: DUF2207 domain-containing protein [Acidimicrobiia bacterium]|nr:DUF2207 domain-containing protein [Acidimicrobiia bacterium]